jgi:hypothetical protein
VPLEKRVGDALERLAEKAPEDGVALATNTVRIGEHGGPTTIGGNYIEITITQNISNTVANPIDNIQGSIGTISGSSCG